MCKRTMTDSYNDDLLWCDDCGDVVSNVCKIHGQLMKVRDHIIPSRARLSLPHCLAIRTVELRAGEKHLYGVYAKKMIQKRTQFGPVEAAEALSSTGTDDFPDLKIFLKNKEWCYLDCTNEDVCNWMMFVRAAKNAEEQNMIAYQYQSKIYFTTIKPVAPGTECKVWYAAPFAQLLDKELYIKSTITPTEKIIQKDVPKEMEPEDIVDALIGTNNGGDDSDGADNDNETFIVQEDPDFCERSATADIAISDIDVKQTLKDMEADLNTPEEMTDVKTDKKDTAWPCSVCKGVFESFAELEGHACKTVTMVTAASPAESAPLEESKIVGRRTRSKRRGRPKKVRTLEPINVIKIKPVRRERKKILCVPKMKKSRGRPKIEKPPPVTKTLYKCTECELVFAKENRLKSHMYKHTGERPFKCDFPGCDKSFTCKFKLARHELIHSQTRNFTCNYCGKAFARKDHLQTHLKSHDPQKSKFICELCGREYQSMQGYKTHRAFHAAEAGDLTCGVCNKEFEEKTDLLCHLKIHTGARWSKRGTEKSFMCPFCSKGFYTGKDLRRHTVVHTKLREYLCQYCPHRFGRRDHLVRHLRRTHSETISGQSASEDHTESKRAKVTLSKFTAHEEFDFRNKILSFDYNSETAVQEELQPQTNGGTNQMQEEDARVKEDRDATVTNLLQRIMYSHVPAEIQHDHGYLQMSSMTQVGADIAASHNNVGSIPTTPTVTMPTQYTIETAPPSHSVTVHEVHDIYSQQQNYQSAPLQQHSNNSLSGENLLSTVDVLKNIGHYSTVNLSQLIQGVPQVHQAPTTVAALLEQKYVP